MPVDRHTDMGDGTAGTYWALCGMRRIARGGDETTVEAEYGLWVDQAAYRAGVTPRRKLQRIRVTVSGSDPKLSEIDAAVAAELLREPVTEVRAVRGRRAVPAGKSDSGVDEPEVPEVAGRRGVRGGLLEGGTLVG